MRVIPKDGHGQAARNCGTPSSHEPHDVGERNPPEIADWDVVLVGPGCMSHNRHDAFRNVSVGIVPRRLPLLSPQSLERTEILPVVVREMRTRTLEHGRILKERGEDFRRGGTHPEGSTNGPRATGSCDLLTAPQSRAPTR